MSKAQTKRTIENVSGLTRDSLQSVPYPAHLVLTPEQARRRMAEEKQAEIARHTARLKEETRDSMRMVVFFATAYLIFVLIKLHHAILHAGTSEADMDWWLIIRVTAALFGFLMVRKGLKWDGRIQS